MKLLKKPICCIALLSLNAVFAAGITKDKRVSELTNTPQTIPFSQNWTNVGLITVSDDWSGVPGVVGYRGDDLTVATGTDPRTILADGAGTPIDVNANQTNPDTFATGGIAEFDTIANPVVAMQGSGTSDAPHLVFHLNTTGQSNITFACNIRDIDAAADDAIQQVDVQYRVGGTGVYASLPGGYIADASTGGTATQVTPLSLTLPAGANNQAIVEVRVITTNAIGSDEWVGVDDVSVTAGPSAPVQNIVDFNGDGRTDFAVVRSNAGQATWLISTNGPGEVSGADWGLSATDYYVPVDFDGDNKSDIVVWRDAPAGTAGFYILQSATGTFRFEQFGQSGDNPNVVGDYDGDGKTDAAVHRQGTQNTWFYRGTLNNPSGNITFVPWGQSGDFPAPGDYDGDGRNDFVVQRANGGQAQFWMLQTTAGFDLISFGTPSSLIVPGDYDGDGKTDLAVVEPISGVYNWFVRPSSTGVISAAPVAIFGNNVTDYITPGDYDGDGRTDPAIWRGSTGDFWSLGSTSGVAVFHWGQNLDIPVAGYNVH